MLTARQWSLGRWALIVVFIVMLAGASPARLVSARPGAQQAATLSWTGPLACPASGCAGGQTVSLRFFFAPQGLSATDSPNLMVCLFAPNNWIDPTAGSGTAYSAYVSNGINTGQAYTRVTDNAVCNGLANRPAGMTSIIQAAASLPVDTSSDAVDFAFRLKPDATGINGVTAMLLSLSGGTPTLQQAASTSAIQVYAPGAISLAYAANDASTCGYYQPCYVNSGVDLANGIGAGLKDAVDSIQPSGTINLLGNYTVKNNTVRVNKAVTLTGLNNASLTYNDQKNCTDPLISLEDAVTLSGLTINDGGCNGSAHRALVRVASAQPVLIQSNTLTGGNDAIVIDSATSGAVTVRFNQITGNAGKSVSYLGDGAQGGPLYVTANNLTSVQCAASGSGVTSIPRYANHNYWTGGLPNVDATRCAINAARRLGLPIAAASAGPGVNAVNATVKSGDASSATSVMDGQVRFYHHADQPDFKIYVVDHGFLSATNASAPFSARQSFNAPMPCSNYWDVFLDESALSTAPSGTLELLLHYGKSSTDECVTAINSTKFCGQTTSPSLYPFYWLNPANSSGWVTTGASGGQATSCDTGKQLIQASIDNEGSPHLTSDLGYTPLMIGVPVLNYFTAAASSGKVTITWATNAEPNIDGFYVLRGTDASNLSPISGLVSSKGTLSSGYTYPAIVDSNRVNDQKYYYQLQIMRTDGTYFFSNLQSVTGTSATATNTPTSTSTPRTPTSTLYPTSTPRPTYIYTRAPTLYSPYRSPSPTRGTLVPSPTFPLLNTLTATPDLNTPGAADTLTAVAATLGTGTPPATSARATASPTPSRTPALSEASSGSRWLSLLFGLLAGLTIVGVVGGAWYYLRLRK